MAGVRGRRAGVTVRTLGARTKLRNIGAVTNTTTRAVLRQGADDIAALASKMTPRDTGALEGSVAPEEVIDAANAYRKAWKVGIDEAATRQKGSKIEYVTRYARVLHRRYPGNASPGQGTLSKGQVESNPSDQSTAIGPRFLTRAALQLQPRIIRALKEAVQRAVERNK